MKGLLSKRRLGTIISLVFFTSLVSCVRPNGSSSDSKSENSTNDSSSVSENTNNESSTSSESSSTSELPSSSEIPSSGNGSNSSELPSSSEIPSSSEPDGGEETHMTNKLFNNATFSNPNRSDRPMVMAHNITRIIVDDVYARGYGGIVTNVAWGNDYLQNSRAFTTLRSNLDYAINTKDLYIWLYDEYGYPSGAAYGQTLKNNPEYEALGLVSQHRVVGPGATVTVDLLYGHSAIVEASVMEGTNTNNMQIETRASVSHLINEAQTQITYTNNSPTSKVLVTFMSKRWYEFTHSMENWYAQQRYINMLDSEPTAKFINITHDQYYEYLSDEFGKGIKAIFTDEPAHQGNYFEVTERNRQVLDVADLNVPIHPSLNYSNTLFDKFTAAYGYDLRPYLAYLHYDDGSSLAKQIRIDFYALTSELFRTKYLGQIEEWSMAHGIKSSGHLLLEENLFQNPWFAGNMIQLLGTMGIPGTDLLFSRPTRAVKDSSIVSKMASSAADFLLKPDTFAEVSGAFDGNRGTVAERVNSIGVQVAMGINNFASYYYQGNDHSEAEDLFFSSAVGRMRYMVDESLHRANVALYYPYEGVSAETLPTTNLNIATTNAKDISDEFRDIANTFVEKQIDFDLIDHINLDKAVIDNGAIVSPNGERFTTIVIPYTTALYSSTILKLHEAANAGVKVILQDLSSIVAERGQNSVAGTFSSLVSKSTSLRTSVNIANYIRNNNLTSFSLSDAYANEIYMSRRENTNYDVFPTVNAGTQNKTVTLTLDGDGKAVKYYNSFDGSVTNIAASFTGNKVSFTFSLPANTTGFFVVEK